MASVFHQSKSVLIRLYYSFSIFDYSNLLSIDFVSYHCFTLLFVVQIIARNLFVTYSLYYLEKGYSGLPFNCSKCDVVFVFNCLLFDLIL